MRRDRRQAFCNLYIPDTLRFIYIPTNIKDSQTRLHNVYHRRTKKRIKNIFRY